MDLNEIKSKLIERKEREGEDYAAYMGIADLIEYLRTQEVNSELNYVTAPISDEPIQPIKPINKGGRPKKRV